MRLILAALLLPSLAMAQDARPTGPGHIGPDAFAQPSLDPALIARLSAAEQEIEFMRRERDMLTRRVQELEAGCEVGRK